MDLRPRKATRPLLGGAVPSHVSAGAPCGGPAWAGGRIFDAVCAGRFACYSASLANTCCVDDFCFWLWLRRKCALISLTRSSRSRGEGKELEAACRLPRGARHLFPKRNRGWTQSRLRTMTIRRLKLQARALCIQIRVRRLVRKRYHTPQAPPARRPETPCPSYVQLHPRPATESKQASSRCVL